MSIKHKITLFLGIVSMVALCGILLLWYFLKDATNPISTPLQEPIVLINTLRTMYASQEALASPGSMPEEINQLIAHGAAITPLVLTELGDSERPIDRYFVLEILCRLYLPAEYSNPPEYYLRTALYDNDGYNRVMAFTIILYYPNARNPSFWSPELHAAANATFESMVMYPHKWIRYRTLKAIHQYVMVNGSDEVSEYLLQVIQEESELSNRLLICAILLHMPPSMEWAPFLITHLEGEETEIGEKAWTVIESWLKQRGEESYVIMLGQLSLADRSREIKQRLGPSMERLFEK